MRRAMLLWITSVAILAMAASAISADDAQSPAFQIKDKFVAEDSGFVLSAKDAQGSLATVNEIDPGRYVLTGEYKTEGMEALGRFASAVNAADGKTALSETDWTCAVPEWSPFVLYITVDAKTTAVLSCGDWQKCSADSRLHLRNLQIRSQEFVDGMNMLVNGDWEQGSRDYLPPTWSWLLGKKNQEVPASYYSLIKNTTYRTGENVLQMVCTKDDDEIMLSSRSFNLPAEGDLELTLWAKADKYCLIRPCIIQGWNRMYVANDVRVLDTWKRYSQTLQITPKTDRKWFFVRLDVKINQDCKVEIADVKVVWHAPAGSTSKPLAAATTQPAGKVAAKAGASK